MLHFARVMRFLDLFRRDPDPPPRVRALARDLADLRDAHEHLVERFEKHLRRESGMMSRGRGAQEPSGATIPPPDGSQVPPLPPAQPAGRLRNLRGF